MTDDVQTTSAIGHPTADEGVRCPQCGYNLTGLPEPRCPECGAAFDWAAVRQAAANPPQIYFERVRGWRGFLVTWTTVLFAPWVFARQAVQRISARHAIVFAAVCFGSTFVAMHVGDADMKFMATWLTTAVAYLLIQAIGLTLVDLPGWRRPLRALRFWVLAGCYLSAVMPTEIVYGPPPLFASDFYRFVFEGVRPPFISGMYDSSTRSVIFWGQMAIWLLGLGCCYYTRLRRGRWPNELVLLATLFVMVGVLALYAVALEYISTPLAQWYGF